MLRLTCPYCGTRNADEFRYGGDASVERPAHDDADQAAWYRYVYIRANPKGWHREHWQHVLGCRRWLIVERDTTTHLIAAVRPAKPEDAA